MLLLVLLVFCGVAAATFDRKIEQTIPMGVGVIMLAGYLGAITNHLSRTVLLSSFLLGVACVLCMSVYYVKNHRITARSEFAAYTDSLIYYDTRKHIESKRTSSLCKVVCDFIRKVACSYLSLGLWFFLVFAGIIVVSTSQHFVTNWDDFNYWANFPKNIFYKDAMLSGGDLTTAYKDYLPIVQILYYTVFKSVGYFNENLMFATNNILLLVYMIPFMFAAGDAVVTKDCKFININGKSQTSANIKVRGRKQFALNIHSQYHISCMITGLLFIPALSFQSFHCLGVDIIISVMFGYALLRILFEKRDLFFYADMMVYLSVLIMIKSASIMIVVIVLIALVVGEIGNLRRSIVNVLLAVPAFCFWGSWRAFCQLKGNVSYLTEKMDDSITGGGFLMFPDYTSEVVGKFFKEIALYPLNDGRFGMSALACIVFTVVVLCIFMKRINGDIMRTTVILALGMVIYIVFLLYTYLFVFEKWEALSLSSFDRYISLYILGPTYLACFIFARYFGKGSKILPLVMLLTLNYPFLINTMVSDNYASYYREIAKKRAEVAKELDVITSGLDGQRILIINSTQDDELEKYQQYEAIPRVSYILHLDYGGSTEDKALVQEQLVDHSLDYALVYSTGEIIERDR